MNRMVRRAEEKKERKAEKDKAKAKAERRARRRERVEQRKRAKAAGSGGGSDVPADQQQATGPRKSNPGRFSGALMAATVFFIALQAVAPTDGTLPSQLVSASFYLLFAYFAVLWMMRRESPRPLAAAIGAAVAMGVATGLSQWLQPDLELAPVMLAAILPLATAGAFLGRLVWRRAP